MRQAIAWPVAPRPGSIGVATGELRVKSPISAPHAVVREVTGAHRLTHRNPRHRRWCPLRIHRSDSQLCCDIIYRQG